MDKTELFYVISGILFLTVFGVYLTLSDLEVGIFLTIISLVWAISMYAFMIKFWKEE
ncbi:MAG: hypothetical protein QXS42_06160 [Zestosphaera sp.]|uniref:Uncharacterized protein n=2 Tax=Metallosphaera TaxID=41980 RepID=F4G2G0_METCR|nr:hypothetical protein [Metallosphaera cuprina]AEB95008.1 hypothetical protein Mcup_0903 [Metallosphaera cuprina Ar-4]